MRGADRMLHFSRVGAASQALLDVGVSEAPRLHGAGDVLGTDQVNQRGRGGVVTDDDHQDRHVVDGELLARDHGAEHAVSASMELRLPCNGCFKIDLPSLCLPEQFAEDEQFEDAGRWKDLPLTKGETPFRVQTANVKGEEPGVFLLQALKFGPELHAVHQAVLRCCGGRGPDGAPRGLRGMGNLRTPVQSNSFCAMIWRETDAEGPARTRAPIERVPRRGTEEAEKARGAIVSPD